MKVTSCTKKLSFVLLALAVGMVVAGALAIYGGVYDVSALKQHTKPVYWFIEGAMRRSVRMRVSKGDVAPAPAGELGDGLRVYHDECERCHGGPGASPEHWALGMMPVPANLSAARTKWTDAEVYWIVRNGIKMTAMPAWQHRLSDQEMWAVSVFVNHALATFTPESYAAALRTDAQKTRVWTEFPAPGDVARGARAMQQYGCVTCHEIPGITGALSYVGPPLNGIGSQTYIAGILQNNTRNMTVWLRSPPKVKKGTAMPDLGVSAQDALDMAAYLGTLQ